MIKFVIKNMQTFVNPRDPNNEVITQKVIEWVRFKFTISADIEIAVSEISCVDPHCVCKETEIQIFTSPITIKKIAKPLTFIRKWDIELLK